ncbi:conserved hypothetical protein [Leishmania braziliensis MHOM/BR/75/M2904]|uniref:RING-type E3 ubiquitin transferase n=1 Tax=Leishmania braziliensis TaxID=5660 RepID=A4HFP6_LEIBR|nr:conserved hypothetical protein [Leishmania braziliensis MHOM/BR/75/M2904]CAJ2475258.1 unnamed protein product [Leishmania braziliensis]CAM45407.2 conserved hypothetical protein [Leishmania braziliensis MHOM/BR/75/M2904]
MLSAMDNRGSTVRSPASAGRRYVAHSACSPVKSNLVEENLIDLCDGGAVVSSQPLSLTSSGRWPCASAASASRMRRTVNTSEERDHTLASFTPNRRPRRKSDASGSLSSSASIRKSLELQSSSSLRAEGKQRRFSAVPKTMKATANLHLGESPLKRSVSRRVRSSVSLESSAQTSRPTEESVPSPTSSVKTLASDSPSVLHSREPSVAVSEEEDLCCICLESYSDDNPMFHGACQHHFHLPCLMEWKQRSSLCPMCCAATLKGVGEFEVAHHSSAADSAGMARQQATTMRDAQVARSLQHKYLRAAQRRGHGDPRFPPSAQPSRVLNSGSPRDLPSRVPPHNAEAGRYLSSTLRSDNSFNSQRPSNVVHVPLSRSSLGPVEEQQQRGAENAFPSSIPPPVHPSLQNARRSRSKLPVACAVM